jgi:uncharacterized protein YjbI with pentapeptide repeats
MLSGPASFCPGVNQPWRHRTQYRQRVLLRRRRKLLDNNLINLNLIKTNLIETNLLNLNLLGVNLINTNLLKTKGEERKWKK